MEYAKFHKLDATTVDLKKVEDSAEGLEYWACFGMDMSARGAVGQAINRSFAKHPKVKEQYRWLTDDLKKKFRMAWAVERDFDKVLRKKLKKVTNTTKQSELGSWKSELQLQNHFGGAQFPEACRQASNYIRMAKHFGDAFVEYNTWTDAETYLLVERLCSTSTSEEWQEVVEMIDESETFALESFRLKARRKYALANHMSLEDVSNEDVEKSPEGIQAWADMALCQVEDKDKSSTTTAPVTPAAKPGKRQREASPPTGEKPTGPPDNPSGQAGGKPKIAKAKSKSTAASRHNRDLEKKAKELLCLTERGNQVIDRVTAESARSPSEWAWSKPLLEEFRAKQEEFQKLLNPPGAEDITEFINEYRLSIISPTALKDLKKNHKDDYFHLLSVFIDRCNSICEQSHNRTQKLL